MRKYEKCSDLTKDRPVVFNLYCEIMKKKEPTDGHVIYVLPNRREVCVGYMEGYKYRTDNIPYEDMLAAYDEEGEMMKFGCIKGPSAILIHE